MDTHPARPSHCVQQGIQYRPIGDGIAAVNHFFSLAIRRSNRSAVEMVASDHDRGADFSAGHEVVEYSPHPCPFTIAKPANARREALEFYLLLRFLYPPAER